MEYQDFIRDVMSLDFIEDSETADAGIKTVLRILTSRMEEPEGRELTERLPEPLSYDNLHQKSGPSVLISLNEAVTKISAQFKLEHTQASRLIGTVLDSVKRAVGKEGTEKLEHHLPPDWVSILRQGTAGKGQFITS